MFSIAALSIDSVENLLLIVAISLLSTPPERTVWNKLLEEIGELVLDWMRRNNVDAEYVLGIWREIMSAVPKTNIVHMQITKVYFFMK